MNFAMRGANKREKGKLTAGEGDRDSQNKSRKSIAVPDQPVFRLI